MRRSDPRVRRTSVLLLLALRTGQWTVGSEGGVCRPCGFGKGTVGSPPSDGRLPPEGRTGIRPAAGADRGLRRGAYLYLEVHAQVVTRHLVGRSSPASDCLAPLRLDRSRRAPKPRRGPRRSRAPVGAGPRRGGSIRLVPRRGSSSPSEQEPNAVSSSLTFDRQSGGLGTTAR